MQKTIVTFIGLSLLLAGCSSAENISPANKETEKMQPTKIVSMDLEEYLDIDEDGIMETITGGYICDEFEKNSYCDYYISISSGEENIIPNTKITATQEYKERESGMQFDGSERGIAMEMTNINRRLGHLIPGKMNSTKYLGDMNNDGVRDILLWFQPGIEMYRAMAIDVKNGEKIGCFSAYVWDKFEETEDGKIKAFFTHMDNGGKWVELNNEFFQNKNCEENLKSCQDYYTECKGRFLTPEKCAEEIENCDYF